MKHEKGFTLIEVLIVMVLLGILVATAFSTYQTFRNRAVGSEAATIMKQLIDAQIIYFLENEKYYPEPGSILEIYHDGTTKIDGTESDTLVQDIKHILKVTIPVGHHLDFTITNSGSEIIVNIGAGFPIFKDGTHNLSRSIDMTGNVT